MAAVFIVVQFAEGSFSAGFTLSVQMSDGLLSIQYLQNILNPVNDSTSNDISACTQLHAWDEML